MKKRSSSRQNPKSAVKAKLAQQSVTIGMDLGDKTSRYCLLSDEGEILREGQVATTKAGMTGTFGCIGRARIAIEVGTHSPWVSRLLRSLGHEIIVANPRQVKLIAESSRKDDRLDAQTLARLARIDPQLLQGSLDRAPLSADNCAVRGMGADPRRSRTVSGSFGSLLFISHWLPGTSFLPLAPLLSALVRARKPAARWGPSFWWGAAISVTASVDQRD